MKDDMTRRDFAKLTGAGAAALAAGGAAMTPHWAMAKEGDRRDIAAEVKKRISERFAEPGRKAREISDAGKLKLVTEKLMQPFEGYGFNLDKGQVIRYELTHGPQIIDTTYLVRSRPIEEWADCWMTGTFGSLVFSEGTHYVSCPPYVRPLLTLFKDTADYEKMHKVCGKLAGHNFFYPHGRCTEGLYEMIFGMPNCNSCNSNLLKGMIEAAGEEVTRALRVPPGVFMHFQTIAFDKVPTNMSYYTNRGMFKKGDYVELLAHEDLYVSVSMCPSGDQHWDEAETVKELSNYPLTYKIYVGEEGPLETVPVPQLKSLEAIDYIKAGRPAW